MIHYLGIMMQYTDNTILYLDITIQSIYLTTIIQDPNGVTSYQFLYITKYRVGIIRYININI